MDPDRQSFHRVLPPWAPFPERFELLDQGTCPDPDGRQHQLEQPILFHSTRLVRRVLTRFHLFGYKGI